MRLLYVQQIVGFLLQQTKGDETKLVETRNLAGETPLLRAMSKGIVSVARVLLEGGSDPLVTDSSGNSIFTKLAKSGHIWCLNFMYNTIW
jgi:ankyrin repeat protein